MIHIIKSELEEVCHAVVSCADILVLASREAVLVNSSLSYVMKLGS